MAEKSRQNGEEKRTLILPGPNGMYSGRPYERYEGTGQDKPDD